MSLIEKLLTNLDWAIAGLIGAIVSVPFHVDLHNFRSRLLFVITGCACAYFTTPLAITLYHIDPGLAGSVSFLLGAFGGSLLAAVMRTVNSLDVISILKERLGVRTDTGEGK